MYFAYGCDDVGETSFPRTAPFIYRTPLMSANVPSSVAEYPLLSILKAAGLTRIHQGKVRDTWELPNSSLLLSLATNRISIFDFVLNALVAGKGETLTAMTVFWINTVLSPAGINHHLIAAGQDIDQHLPSALRGISELQKQAVVVKRCQMDLVEFIARAHLTGSGFISYQATGHLFGVKLPLGLQDGSKLEPIQFTPTTKAEVGHDEPMSADQVRGQYPKQSALTLAIYELIANYALERGIIFADTKFEFGKNEGEITLADEIGTPDSSRWWDLRDWETQLATGKTPNPFDKQFVRNWGKTQGVHKRKPENPADIAFVHGLVVPTDIIETTQGLYAAIFERLTGCSLQDFQRRFMRV